MMENHFILFFTLRCCLGSDSWTNSQSLLQFFHSSLKPSIHFMRFLNFIKLFSAQWFFFFRFYVFSSLFLCIVTNLLVLLNNDDDDDDGVFRWIRANISRIYFINASGKYVDENLNVLMDRKCSELISSLKFLLVVVV